MSSVNWEHILINGKFKLVEVLDPVVEKGIIKNIKGLRPEIKDDKGAVIEPTIELANSLKRSIYSEFFKKPFKNLLVLSGAGSSMDVGGLSMFQLWAKVDEKYKKDQDDGFATIRKEINFTSQNWDLEGLLSQIDGYSKFAGDKEIKIHGFKKKISVIKKEIFNLIKTHCSINKPESFFPHEVFLRKLLQRKQTNPRIKIFTLNYDLLFEYAATEVNAVVIDGFSFTIPRTFSGRFFDYDIVQREGSKLHEEDNFIQRVFHLHKLHGSLNWERKDSQVIITDNPDTPLMVYPRDAKYEDSYEQPFFEMMARFQRSLRLSNDTLLLCIGYSFNDKHINAAIEEALNQNPGFRLAVIDPGFNNQKATSCLKEIRSNALESDRIIMVAETFSDFARHFPEIKTYENVDPATISLKNDRPQD